MSQENPKPLLAFEVISCTGEEAEVVFTSSRIEAYRRGADDFHGGELGGLKVRRVPGADQYSPGPTPIGFLVEILGWNYECSGCYQVVSAYDEEFPGRNYKKNHVFCNRWCRQRFYERLGQESTENELGILRAKEFLSKSIPRDSFRAYPSSRYDARERKSYVTTVVEFSFPGGQFKGHWEVGDKQVSVAQIDLDAYLAMVAADGNISDSGRSSPDSSGSQSANREGGD